MSFVYGGRSIRVYSAYVRKEGASDYTRRLFRFMELAEDYQYDGILLFQNNAKDIEPWTFAQDILLRSETLSPFVAVNPVYMHPYTAAQKILAQAKIYERRLTLNFITGTSISDLLALGDRLDHDSRYDRLLEYITIVNGLLRNASQLTFSGQYYQVSNLRTASVLSKDLFPIEFIAGSSEKARKIRSATGCHHLEMLKPIPALGQYSQTAEALHLGILARPTRGEALEAMSTKFKSNDLSGRLLSQSIENTDSTWKKDLALQAETDVFKLTAFRSFAADCPFLVGSYAEVAAHLRMCLDAGQIHTLMIEVGDDEFPFVDQVLRMLKL